MLSRLMAWPARAGWLAPFLVATPVVSAQEPSAALSQVPDVVVTGRADRNKAITSFSRHLTRSYPDDPLPLYEQGVFCPAIIGLSAPLAAKIAARMRAVATASGAAPAADGCAPSVLVIATSDVAALLKQFRLRRPIYINYADRNLWRKQPDDAVAWHIVARVDRDGKPIGKIVRGEASRIRANIRLVIAMSVVVLHDEAIRGLTATQVADYAVMRALSDVTPSDLRKMDTSVTVLSAVGAPMGSAVPVTLTDWDLSYLRGRYSGNPYFFGFRQQTMIQQAMRKGVGAGIAGVTDAAR